MRRFIITFFASILISGIFAQDQFQRLFTSDEGNIYTLGIEPARDGGFFLLNAYAELANITGVADKLLITRHNFKGDIQWSNVYTIENGGVLTTEKSTDLTVLNNDTLVIVGSSVIDVDNEMMIDERFIIKLNPQNGSIISTQEVSNVSDKDAAMPLTYPYILNGYDSDYNYFACHSNGDTLGVSRLHFDSNDTLLNTSTYCSLGQDQSIGFASLTDAQNTVDSNYIFTFNSDSSLTKAALIKISADGQVLDADEYTLSQDSLQNFEMKVHQISSTPDSGAVLIGNIFQANLDISFEFVIKVDKVGDIEWSKVVDGTLEGLSTRLNDIVVTSQDEYLLTGKYFNNITQEAADYSVFLDTSGNVLRQWDYNSEHSFFILNDPGSGTILQFNNGEVVNVTDGGMVYATLGIDLQDIRLFPYTIKMDSIGQAFCHDTLDFDLVRDYEFIHSSIGVGQSDFAELDTLQIERQNYDKFNVPVISLLDTIFCPQDPILVNLDATAEGATMYEWSTGETSSNILVTEEGQYSVTVTIGEKLCYTLCDTANISQRDFPEATINAQFFQTCSIDSFNLIAGSNNFIQSIMWSTGDTVSPVITESAFGTYGLTVVDFCGNSADAEINIQDVEPLMLEANVSETGVCESQQLLVEIVPSTTLGPIMYEWSNGSTSNTISNLVAGVYTVTVTDDCSSVVDSFEISEGIEFPNIFFPQRAIHDENKQFGAHLDCPDQFEGQNYNLEIYNRFGNKVFETNNVNSRWNGTVDGDFAPRDVYMYQWSYELSDGTEVLGEGTITLHR